MADGKPLTGIRTGLGWRAGEIPRPASKSPAAIKKRK